MKKSPRSMFRIIFSAAWTLFPLGHSSLVKALPLFSAATLALTTGIASARGGADDAPGDDHGNHPEPGDDKGGDTSTDDVDHDGISDGQDDDVDGDGKLNGHDRDIDGDGKVNKHDRDMDGDGKPNQRDNDIDGDGIPNSRDSSPAGR